MATDSRDRRSTIRPYRFTVSKYLAMIAAGVFSEEARVELLGGIAVEQMTKFPPHNFAARQLGLFLSQMVPLGWIVSEEKSLELGRYWRPEPDIAVIRGPNDLYRSRDPRASDVELLIEVADSSYARDRGPKWRAYASARIENYWIVNLSGRLVEVYNAPTGRGKSATYRQALIFDHEAEVPVVIDGQDVGRVVVKDILP